MARPFIIRRLWHEDGPEIRHVDQDFLTSDARSLVVLGEAGMGKSTLLTQLAGIESYKFCTARQLVNHPTPAVLLGHATTLVIDGLDEVSAGREGDAVDRVVQRLWALGCPRFILSCRVADWRGATARQGLKDAYGTSAVELHLDALGREDAVAFLAATLGDPEAEAVVRHFEERGLEGLWANPQTLDFVERVAAGGELPDTKGDLFSDAVEILRTEHREEKEATPLAGMPGDEVLDAAGAAFAALILTGKEALSRRAMPTGEDLVLAEVRALPGADRLADILDSRLFAAAGSERFTYAHRAIGEFLGARWLSRQANTPRKRRRLLSLLHEQELVPASLRGIHAWLAWHSADLAGDVVTADPLGIAEYGDAERLGSSQAFALLRALERLSDENPQLMGWRRPKFDGLARRELLPEIRRFLLSREAGFGLRITLLQALERAAIAGELKDVLLGVLADPKDIFAIRKWAGVVLVRLAHGPDWTTIIPSLLTEEGHDGPRLAIELGCRVGLGGFNDPTLLAIVLGQLGRLEGQVGVFHLFEGLLPANRIDALLDGLSGERRLGGDGHGRTGHDSLGTLVFGLAIRRLEVGPVKPERFWWWCEPFTDRLSPRDTTWERVGELVRLDHFLRHGVQSHVLLDQPDDGHLRYRGWRLNRLPGLEMAGEDVIRLLSTLDASNGRWRDIVLLVSHSQTEGEAVRAAATRFATNAEDKKWLSELPIPRTPEWKIEQQERARATKVKERRRWASHRANYRRGISLLRSGNGGMLSEPAQAYLNQFADLTQACTGQDRLALWLGPELRDACLDGFEAYIRADAARPTPTDIAVSHAEGRRWPAAQVTVAGLAERHRIGKGLADLSSERLAVGLMELWRSMVAQDAGLQDLEGILAAELRVRGRWEDVQLTYVEPLLERGTDGAREVRRLMWEAADAVLAADLAEEWLRRFPRMSQRAEAEIIDFLLRYGRCQVLGQLANDRRAGALDEERRRDWETVAVVTDFKAASKELDSRGPVEPELLWHFRDRLEPPRGERQCAGLDGSQLAWLVKRFRSLFPASFRPLSGTYGDLNPWDATEYIFGLISRLGDDTTQEAADLLAALRDTPRDGYTDHLRAVAAEQRRKGTEEAYRPSDLRAVAAAMSDSAPTTSRQLQEVLLEELVEIQRKLKGSDVDWYADFYRGQASRDEEGCRDTLLKMLRPLPFGVDVLPEGHLADDKRCDVACVLPGLLVPIEVKGQWHRDLWTAADQQLDKLYANDHRADCGIYLVLWFGNTPSKGLRRPPKQIAMPETPEELRARLEVSSASACQGRIRIVVLDLVRPR